MSPSRTRSSSAPILTAVVLAVIVLLGLLAFVAGSGGDPATAATVSGDPLPEYVQGGEDPAVGMEAPTITGTSLEGEELVYDPGEDGPAVVVFLAHWCPACNAEAPIIQSLADEGLFGDVTLMTVSTGIDPDRPNYPPSEWFENFDWTSTVMVDGDNGVAEAYGLTAYPYWVFVDEGGEIVGRVTGQLDEAAIRSVVEQLAQ